jgi:hypothetical protein
MCRFGLTLVLLEIALCHPVVAQNLPSAEVFGGYSYLNVDVQSGTTPSPGFTPIPRQSANGWEAAARKFGRSRDGRSADLATRWPGDKVPENRSYERHLRIDSR